jgi:hypothetical protein
MPESFGLRIALDPEAGRTSVEGQLELTVVSRDDEATPPTLTPGNGLGIDANALDEIIDWATAAKGMLP